MSTPRTVEQQLLAGAERALKRAAAPIGRSHDVRLEILEAVASRIGGFDLEGYRDLVATETVLPVSDALIAAEEVLEALRCGPTHPSLALTALARPSIIRGEQRETGAYYTDFRLAQFLAAKLPAEMAPVLDPAAGTGILLVATGLHVAGVDRLASAEFLRRCVHAADLSAAALRGAALALSSLTDDLSAVASMLPRLRCLDSLTARSNAWADVAPNGFARVIGNPPWEKLKLNRHEFVAWAKPLVDGSGDGGTSRHYGADIYLEHEDTGRLAARRAELASYVGDLSHAFALQGTGEPDAYKLFLELAFQQLAKDGEIALLLPAGLIRSHGTRRLREFLFDAASQVEVTVLDNRARFFAIDTRFKFIALHATRATGARASAVVLQHAVGTQARVEETSSVRLGRALLKTIRPDLTIPEVKSPAEWAIFRLMSEHGKRLDDPGAPWQPHVVREVDMTRFRTSFARRPAPDCLPVAEGRMVHQHRFGVKAYISGSGRRALWTPRPLGRESIAPQFWLPEGRLTAALRSRAATSRVGFCDITGQTNERSLLAARVPAGVVCGNKVPTILFGGPHQSETLREELADLWLAIANSIALDWYARRVLTTTVNYFILFGLAYPTLDSASLPARRLIALSRSLEQARRAGDAQQWAEIRAEIDARVLQLYSITVEQARVMFRDFPLLDRGQPPIDGEQRSTITRDLVLTHLARITGEGLPAEAGRAQAASAAGACAYIPAEWADDEPRIEEEVDIG